MKLVCMFTQSSTPNQTRSIPSFAATGASSGTTMKAISKKSRKKARKKTKTLTKIRKPTCPPGRLVSMCSIQRPPSMPWKTRLNRSEEHTSELQSRQYLVCRLLLEKKKNKEE